MFFAPGNKKSEPILIKIKIGNLGQDPPASSKALNKYLKDMDVLCTFKIKIESKGVSNTSDNIQIKIKIPNPSQKPPGIFEAPNQDLKEIHIREFVF